MNSIPSTSHSGYPQSRSLPPSSIFNSNSTFNLNRYSLPQGTRVNWTRWASSNQSNSSNPPTPPTSSAKGKQKESDSIQMEPTNSQNRQVEQLNSTQQGNQEEGLTAEQQEARTEQEDQDQEQLLLTSTWRKVNKWQKTQRRNQSKLNGGIKSQVESRRDDEVKALLQPTLYFLQLEQPTTSNAAEMPSRTCNSISSQHDEGRSKSSPAPRVNGKRKVRGGDVAEESGNGLTATPSQLQEATPDSSSSRNHSGIARKCKAMWSFEISWDPVEQQGDQITLKEETHVIQVQDDLLSQAEEQKSEALAILEGIKSECYLSLAPAGRLASSLKSMLTPSPLTLSLCRRLNRLLRSERGLPRSFLFCIFAILDRLCTSKPGLQGAKPMVDESSGFTFSR